MLAEINTISDIIYDVKQNITDNQYKTVLESLAKLVPTTKDHDNLLAEYTNDFYKQFFYHNHINNFQFNYTYFEQSNTLWIQHTGVSPHQISINQQFLYSKSFNPTTRDIKISYARVLKLLPKYSIIEYSGRQKKISNRTLSKIFFYPYVYFK